MRVYVVGYGERGEGHDPQVACRSIYAAKRYITQTWGITVESRGLGYWMGTLNGVDEAIVSRLEIRGAS